MHDKLRGEPTTVGGAAVVERRQDVKFTKSERRRLRERQVEADERERHRQREQQMEAAERARDMQRKESEKIIFWHSESISAPPFLVLHNNRITPTSIQYCLPVIDEVVVSIEGRSLHYCFSENLICNPWLCSVILKDPGEISTIWAHYLVCFCLNNQNLMCRSTLLLIDCLESLTNYVFSRKDLSEEDQNLNREISRQLRKQRLRYNERMGLVSVNYKSSVPKQREKKEKGSSAGRAPRNPAVQIQRGYEWEKDNYVDENGRIRGTYSYNVSDFK